VRRELQETLKRLKALPKQQLLPPTNGNGNGATEATQDGPAPLLARCREIAMQIQVCLFSVLSVTHTRAMIQRAMSDSAFLALHPGWPI
jgi:hypothetical protein